MPFDVATLEVTGAPVPVVDNVGMLLTSGIVEFGISDNGSLLYAPWSSRGDERTIAWVDREGRSEPIIETPRPFWQVRLSPDERSLAIALDGPNISLWTYDLSRGTLTPLQSGFHNMFPLWSPDGRRIAFASDRDGDSALYWTTADGSDPTERLAAAEDPLKMPQWPTSWSRDGSGIAFWGSRPETGSDIGVLALDGNRVPQVFLQTRFHETNPMFSPDGKWIAYESDESGRNEIYLRSFPDSGIKRRVSTDGGTHAVWNPNGQELFYLNGDKLMTVDTDLLSEPVLGKPRELFSRPTLSSDRYDVSRGGQRFVMIDEGEDEPPPKQLHLVQNWFDELNRLVPTDTPD